MRWRRLGSLPPPTTYDVCARNGDKNRRPQQAEEEKEEEQQHQQQQASTISLTDLCRWQDAAADARCEEGGQGCHMILANEQRAAGSKERMCVDVQCSQFSVRDRPLIGQWQWAALVAGQSSSTCVLHPPMATTTAAPPPPPRCAPGTMRFPSLEHVSRDMVSLITFVPHFLFYDHFVVDRFPHSESSCDPL